MTIIWTPCNWAVGQEWSEADPAGLAISFLPSFRSVPEVYSRTRRDWFLGESAGNLGGLLSVPWDLSCINGLKRIRGLQFDVLRLNKLLR